MFLPFLSCLVFIICPCLMVSAQDTDIYGTVNVGELKTVNGSNTTIVSANPQSFTVTANDEQGVIPVYLLLYNDTRVIPEFDTALISGDISVICSVITTYSEGDSVISFIDDIIPQGSTTAAITYNVVESGRPVEVQCNGEYIDSNNNGFFNFTTSAGFPGIVTVQKSPIVSFCEDIVTVPNEDKIEPVYTVTVKLSEVAQGSDVLIECQVTSVITGTSPMQISFDNGVIFDGSQETEIPYKVYERGDPVQAECRAESVNGTQFMTNTSADNAIFRLDDGSVQLIPAFNDVTKPQLDVSLVLDKPIEAGTLYLTCRLTSVDSPEEARQTAMFPICEDVDFSRPSAAPQPNITDPSNETTTASPVSTNQPTTQITAGTMTTAGFVSNASTYWYLEQSAFQFNRDEYYKPVVVKHLTPWYEAVQELVVITCCVPSTDLNENARFMNASTALLMVVDMKADIPINWTLSSTIETKDTETAITNPAYLELAPCACDMKRDSCDTNCCCDNDCTEDDLLTFSSCIEGLEGGQEGDPYQYVCDNINVYTPDWHPLMCVELYSTPYLGMYFDTKYGVKNTEEYDTALDESNDANNYSYRDTGRSYALQDPKYIQGYPVRTRYNEIGRNGYLSLPTTSPTTGACTWKSPVQYLIDTNTSCIQVPQQSLCTSTSYLSARMYVVSSQINHPPCPDFPTVVKNPEVSHSEVVPVTTEYYCTDDVTPFQQSNLTTEELIPRFQTSLFPDNTTDTNRIDTSQLSRCPWDDGYTYPPAPEYDFDIGVCNNAVLSSSYEINWRGSDIISMTAKFILGGISLDRDPSIEPTESPLLEDPSENYTLPFVPTTQATLTTVNTSFTTAAPITDIVTENNTFEIPTEEGTTEDYTSLASMRVPTTIDLTTVAATTLQPTTPAVSTPSPFNATTQQPTPEQNATLTGFPPFTQFFSVAYIYQNLPEENTESGIIEPAAEPIERSGNPGYVIGKLVLTGEAVYDVAEVIVNDTVLNCTQVGNATLPPECNVTETLTTNISPTEPVSTFVEVDTSNNHRLKLWKPGAGSLCAESEFMDVYFGEDVVSGCLIRLGWSQFLDCENLRNLMEQELIKLFPADKIGKRGNADSSMESDWATIFNPIDHEYTETTIEPSTTTVPSTTTMDTLPPGQIEVTPDNPSTLEQIVGTCYDVPTGINIEILIAEVGEYRGTKQREIVSAKVTYTTTPLKLNCIGANGVSCYGNSSVGDEEPVQSFPITSSVTFITVPAVQPEPVISYYVNYTDVCKYDTCVEEAFYPMTVHNPNGLYQQNLGYGLFLLLVVMGFYAISRPWF